MAEVTAQTTIEAPFALPNGTQLRNRMVKAALSEQLGTSRTPRVASWSASNARVE